MDFIAVIRSVLVLLIVVVFANFSLKLLNRYMVRQNKMMTIIERLSVSNTSSICIVKIVNSYYLMSLSNSENKIIRELSGEEIERCLAEIREQDGINYRSFSHDNFNAIMEKTKKHFGLGKKS